MTGVLTLRPPDQPNAGRPLLSVRGLRKSFVQHLLGGTRLTVLDSIDLDLVRGGCMVLGGHSGSGKSTLLRCIHRSCIPDAGSILLDAARGPIDLVTADDRMVLAARRDLVGMCTQFLTVVPRVGAADLVATEAGSRGAAMELLASLGLSAERQEAPPATFSGGERQMVALALALARPRPLLLLDEATASLDPERRRRALDAILAAKRGGSTILAVFHDIPTAPGLVDEVLRLRDGRVER